MALLTLPLPASNKHKAMQQPGKGLQGLEVKQILSQTYTGSSSLY